MAINEFRIAQPYVLTQEDKDAIDKAKSDPPQKEDWNKSCLNDFKARFKLHTKHQQKYRCAFCNRLMDESMFYIEIEHITPKQLHPQWTLEPMNLMLSCKACNNLKNTKETLSNPKVKNYPKSSRAFKLVNPYYDNYLDHIEIIEELIYRPKSRKGDFTITLCKLNEESRLEKRAIFNILDEKVTYAALLQLINDRKYSYIFNNDFKESIEEAIKKALGI